MGCSDVDALLFDDHAEGDVHVVLLEQALWCLDGRESGAERQVGVSDGLSGGGVQRLGEFLVVPTNA